VAGQWPTACAADGWVDAWRAASVAAVGGEDAGQAFGHEWSQQRQTGTDNTDVGLDGAPGGSSRVVVALVGAVGYGDERLEAQDGDDADTAQG
jgi:hypothetical protein